MMDELIDHQTDDTAASFAERFIVVRGRQHLHKTTAGWWICVLWKNGETSWERLADLKEIHWKLPNVHWHKELITKQLLMVDSMCDQEA
jgi:hypothetical protein